MAKFLTKNILITREPENKVGNYNTFLTNIVSNLLSMIYQSKFECNIDLNDNSIFYLF